MKYKKFQGNLFNSYLCVTGSAVCMGCFVCSNTRIQGSNTIYVSNGSVSGMPYLAVRALKSLPSFATSIYSNARSTLELATLFRNNTRESQKSYASHTNIGYRRDFGCR